MNNIGHVVDVEDDADLELSTASRKMVQSLKKTIW